MTLPHPSFVHLARMTDDTGLFEHALGPIPRRADGWCTDDNGRALAVVSRAPKDPLTERLAERYLAFLLHAHTGGGVFHLRMAFDRRWTDDPSSDDANGRALFGLAVAAARGPEALRGVAAELFGLAAVFRSDHPRATAHAAVAAAEMLAAHPTDATARGVLEDAGRSLPRPLAGDDGGWIWPAARLTYANPLISEALIAVGATLGDDGALADGLRLLGWLTDQETFEGRFSFVPTGGRGPGEPRPAFDQQPIEAASFADAFARAFDVTGDPRWLGGLRRAAGWVCGENDAGASLVDPRSGAGFDGLTPDGVNLNQGAESTLAVLSTLQQAERLLSPSR